MAAKGGGAVNGPDELDALAERLDLSELSRAQIEPLERRMGAEWSDTWRELARSQFVTLLSLPQAEPPEACAAKAVALTLGIAQDIGGAQHYIQAGTALLRNRRAQHVMRLRELGMGYAEVARACGLSDSRVRRIEQAYRSAQRAQEAERFARAQGQLPL